MLRPSVTFFVRVSTFLMHISLYLLSSKRSNVTHSSERIWGGGNEEEEKKKKKKLEKVKQKRECGYGGYSTNIEEYTGMFT